MVMIMHRYTYVCVHFYSTYISNYVQAYVHYKCSIDVCNVLYTKHKQPGTFKEVQPSKVESRVLRVALMYSTLR